jgi:two-component system, OmpR family, sensor histidine kinase MtrB
VADATRTAFRPQLRRRDGRTRFVPPATRLRVGRGPAGLAAAVSHDFAQPLSTVTSLADLLADGWSDLGDGDRHDLAARIDAGARRLATHYRHMVVIMDVLSGRIAAGAVAEVRTSVDAAVATIPAHDRVGVSGPHARASIDGDHLAHVVATLVADALAHGRPPVRVRIRPDRGSVRIEVSDHGRDVLRRIRAHVRPATGGRWTSIGRETPRSRSLGLAIAARLIGSDGGTLIRRPMRKSSGGRIIIRLALAP